jgi:prepilin-type N-terminal cleavage/methylation domain-containing protein
MKNAPNHTPGNSSGFTLIEILISLGILGVIMVLTLQYMLSVSRISNMISANAENMEELRNAMAIMNDEVSRAVYIFPPNAGLPAQYAISSINLGGGRFRTQPNGGGTTWTVGSITNPILAMITTPRNNAVTCFVDNAGCFQFVAFYATKRSDDIENPLTTTETLASEPANDNQWVLVEYRRALNQNAPAQAAMPIPGGGTVNVPIVRWDLASCTTTANAPNPPTTQCVAPYTQPVPDPNPAFQANSNLAIPVGFSTATMRERVVYWAKIQQAIRCMVSNVATPGMACTATGQPNILADNIRPNGGFQVLFNAADIDARGLTQVRIQLQGETFRSGTATRFPQTPLETQIWPRSIPQL